MIKKTLYTLLLLPFYAHSNAFTDLPYDVVGKTYDATRCADPEVLEGFINYMHMEQGKRYLDVSCGSGNYTVALFKKGYDIMGIDISSEMLKKARAKDPSLPLLQGDAHKLPFEDNGFDGVFCIHAVHHYRDLEIVLKEMYRILAPGGKLLIFTSFIEQTATAWICYYFPYMLEGCKITLKSQNDFTTALKTAGFQTVICEKYFVNTKTKDLTIHGGKYKPEIYLDPVVRAGMTPFSFPQYKEEITTGLAQLQADIESGKINDIIKQYESDLGEHAYILAIK